MVCVACAGFTALPGRHDVPCSVGVGTVRAAGRPGDVVAHLGDHRGDPRCAGRRRTRRWTRWRVQRWFGRVCRGRGGALAGQARLEQAARAPAPPAARRATMSRRPRAPGWSRGSSSTSATGSGLSSDDSKTSSDSKTKRRPGTETRQACRRRFPAAPAAKAAVRAPARPAASPPTRSGASESSTVCSPGSAGSSAACSADEKVGPVAALEGGAAAVRPQG